MAWGLISSDSITDKIYKHDGFSSSILDSFSSPGSEQTGVALDSSGNLLSTDTSTDKIYQHDGFSSSILDSFSSPAAAPVALFWDGTNLLSADTGTDKIYKHSGFSSSITDSFSSPGAGPSGLSFLGPNLLSSDYLTHRIYMHDGFSNSVLGSFLGPGSYTTGIACDGTDLFSADATTDMIYKHSGFYPIITDSFSSPSTFPRGLAFIPGSDITITPDQIDISAALPAIAEFKLDMVLQPDPIDVLASQPIPMLFIVNTPVGLVNVRFRFTLVHSVEGDIVIPISSFVTNLRNCQDSYVQVSIPDYDTYITACQDRENGGQLKIEKSINNGAYQEICLIDIDTITEDIGAKNKTITITGHSIFYNYTPATVTLIGVESIKSSPLKTMNCSIMNTVAPGDIVLYRDYLFIPSRVRIQANEIGASVQVEESGIIPYLGFYYPVEDGDDYYWHGTSFYNDLTYLKMGKPTEEVHHTGICFKNILIPQGATISSAFITLTGNETDYSPVNVKIYGNDVNNASPPASAAAADALVLTTAYKDWDAVPDFTPNGKFISPNLSEIIQEIVDRSGWAPGNAIQILFKDNASGDDTLRSARSVEWGDPLTGICKPELQIIWEG